MAESEFRDRAFFNAQDGVTGRDGGPYLDQVERVNAEKRRAFLEGRDAESDADLLNEALPAAVGTDLRVAALVPDNRLTSNPSMRNQPGLEQAITDETFTENQTLADPIAVLSVDVSGAAAPAPTFENGENVQAGGGTRVRSDQDIAATNDAVVRRDTEDNGDGDGDGDGDVTVNENADGTLDLTGDEDNR